MIKKKVTLKQLKNLFREREYNSSFTKYLAIKLFNDPAHPISKIDDFEIRYHLFDYIEVIHDEHRIPTRETL